MAAAEQVEAVLPASGGVAEVVADKGYHANETMVALAELELRSFVSEPDRGRRRWRTPRRGVCQPVADSAPPGRRLLRQRRERLERPNAHLYVDTAGCSCC